MGGKRTARCSPGKVAVLSQSDRVQFRDASVTVLPEGLRLLARVSTPQVLSGLRFRRLLSRLPDSGAVMYFGPDKQKNLGIRETIIS